MEKIRVVELFAGVGGFRLGLEQASANFQTVWANQWETIHAVPSLLSSATNGISGIVQNTFVRTS